MVALGIVMAGIGRTRISPEVEHFMHEFWELVAFVANVIIFIVVGVVIAQNANLTWYGFCHSWPGLPGDSCGSCDKYGIFYPLMKKAGYGLPRKTLLSFGGER